MSRRLILASASPRRRELLAAAGFQFEAISPSVVEISCAGLTVRELTLCNANRKGVAVASKFPDAVILAADTLVSIEGTIIGKPVDLREAAATLRHLSGRTHEVCSAVYIAAKTGVCCLTQTSAVRFRRLSERDIRNYLATIDPLDKAGAYAAQESGGQIIERIEGSYTNVVGLAMEEMVLTLRDFGIEPPRPNDGRRPRDRAGRDGVAAIAAAPGTKTRR